MKSTLLICLLALSSACASTARAGRDVASLKDVVAEVEVRGEPVRLTTVDRGWSSRTGAVTISGEKSRDLFPTIEAVRSYLLIYEARSGESFERIKPDFEAKAKEQCQAYGAAEKADPRNLVEGYVTAVSARIANALEMKAEATMRYVCLISVLAARPTSAPTKPGERST